MPSLARCPPRLPCLPPLQTRAHVAPPPQEYGAAAASCSELGGRLAGPVSAQSDPWEVAVLLALCGKCVCGFNCVPLHAQRVGGDGGRAGGTSGQQARRKGYGKDEAEMLYLGILVSRHDELLASLSQLMNVLRAHRA